jgi:hypothetical protein
MLDRTAASPHRIDNKQQFYRLSRAGLLGNTIRQWTGPQFNQLTSFPTRVAVRAMTTASREFQGCDLTPAEAYQRYQRAAKRGLEVLIDEQAPDDRSLIKGEIMRDQYCWYLRYDCTPGLRMRDAYPVMKHAYGLLARSLVHSYMDAPSWDCLQDLFDRYPDSIVEFTVYDHRLGRFGWNTVFWEVRNY